MIEEDQNDGSPELAIRDESKPNEPAEETAAKPKDPVQAFRDAAHDLEGLARSLKANQQRSRFRVVG